MTELVTGLDLVREQLWLAAGAPAVGGRRGRGRASGDPGSATPSRSACPPRTRPGPSRRPPGGSIAGRCRPGPGVRVDTAMAAGDRVPPDYDPLIAKIMVHAADRPAAIDRLRRALDETEVGGIQTTLPFHRHVARDPSFLAAELSTGWVDDHWDGPARSGRGGPARAARRRPRGPSPGPVERRQSRSRRRRGPRSRPRPSAGRPSGRPPGALPGCADAVDRWPAGGRARRQPKSRRPSGSAWPGATRLEERPGPHAGRGRPDAVAIGLRPRAPMDPADGRPSVERRIPDPVLLGAARRRATDGALVGRGRGRWLAARGRARAGASSGPAGARPPGPSRRGDGRPARDPGDHPGSDRGRVSGRRARPSRPGSSSSSSRR